MCRDALRRLVLGTAGRLLAKDDPAAGGALIERALGLFEAMGATGWVTETRARADARPARRYRVAAAQPLRAGAACEVETFDEQRPEARIVQ
jgi:hypothetical protein